MFLFCSVGTSIGRQIELNFLCHFSFRRKNERESHLIITDRFLETMANRPRLHIWRCWCMICCGIVLFLRVLWTL